MGQPVVDTLLPYSCWLRCIIFGVSKGQTETRLCSGRQQPCISLDSSEQERLLHLQVPALIQVFTCQWRTSVEDVNVDTWSSPTYVAVNIKASKTDPFRQGVTIYLGRTHNQMCPVAAALNYLVTRSTLKGPLFTFEDRRHLTCDRFVVAVRKALLAAGVDTSKYVCRPQFSDRGSHHSSRAWHPRLPY